MNYCIEILNLRSISGKPSIEEILSALCLVFIHCVVYVEILTVDAAKVNHYAREQFNRSKQLLALADDADLIGRGTISVKEMFYDMDTEAESIGFNVSEDETKYFMAFLFS